MVRTLLLGLGKALTNLRYRTKCPGAAEIAAKGKSGILFLPNHPALVDPLILRLHLHRPFDPYVLADRDRVGSPLLRPILKLARIIVLPSPTAERQAGRAVVEETLELCASRLRSGANVVIYPAGRILRSRWESLRGNSAVWAILQKVPDARVVLIRTDGLWGSRFSWGVTGASPDVPRVVRQCVWDVLRNAVFFLPKRDVTLEFVEPADFPAAADRQTINRYLENFYNQGARPNTYVPRAFWERGGTRVVPEPSLNVPAAIEFSGEDAASRTIQKNILAKIAEVSGATGIGPKDHLGRDLGLDSLAIADLGQWVSREYGTDIPDMESLVTVADLLRLAAGQVTASAALPTAPVPAKWFRANAGRTVGPKAPTVPGAFLDQALRTPGFPAMADQSSGVKTYRDIVTGCFALRKVFQALEGERVGIMLPASVAAALTFLAVHFSGKVPVMVNWTTGEGPMTHSLDGLGVRCILTSRRLLGILEARGVTLKGLADRMVCLEDLKGRISLARKVAAALSARIRPRALLPRRISPEDPAAILFTSGSENLPKSVPLTHANVLSNVRAALQIIDLRQDEVMMGFLPPFHSFGLTCTMVVPLSTGLRVVYHTNPTEGDAIAQLCGAYQATMLVGTPTFLRGIVRAGRGSQLQRLRLAITGAEKCPDSLFEESGQKCPGLVVVEGYGITECSPIVAANDPAHPRRGSIGRLLPTFEGVVVVPETGLPAAPGERGELYVRGPSVFRGYLGEGVRQPFRTFAGREWYPTGDLVTMDADGLIAFAGRIKRFAKIGGEMVSLPAVEEVLSARFTPPDAETAVLAVEATAGEGRPDLVLFTVLDLDRETANRALREAGLSPLHFVQRVVRLEAIPLLGTGKADYRSLRESLREEP